MQWAGPGCHAVREMSIDSDRWSERIGAGGAAVLGGLAAIAYSAWLVEFRLGSGLSPRASYVSELGAATQPHAEFFNGLDLATGACIIVLAYALHRRIRHHRLLDLGCLALGAFGLGSALEAALPLDCAPSLDAQCAAREFSGHGISWHDRGHTLSSVFSIVAILVSMSLLGWALRNRPRWRWPARCWLVATPFIALLSGYVGLLAIYRRPVGLAERAMVSCFSLWVLLVAGTLLLAVIRKRRPPVGFTRGRESPARE